MYIKEERQKQRQTAATKINTEGKTERKKNIDRQRQKERWRNKDRKEQ